MPPSVLRALLCGGIPAQAVGAQSLWWESRICLVWSHVFPQVVLTAITLVGAQTRDGGALPEAECEASLSPDQWTYWPYQGWDPIPRYWSKSLGGSSPRYLNFIYWCAFPSSRTGTFSPELGNLKAWGSNMGSQSMSQSEAWDVSTALPEGSAVISFIWLRCSLGYESH